MKLGFPRYSLGLEASHTSAWKDCQHATSVFNSSFTAAMSKLQQSFSHSEIVIQFHLIICSCFQASHTAAGLFLETNGLIDSLISGPNLCESNSIQHHNCLKHIFVNQHQRKQLIKCAHLSRGLKLHLPEHLIKRDFSDAAAFLVAVN